MPGSARDGLADLKGLSMPFYFSPPIFFFFFLFFSSFLSTVKGGMITLYMWEVCV